MTKDMVSCRGGASPFTVPGYGIGWVPSLSLWAIVGESANVLDSIQTSANLEPIVFLTSKLEERV
jgi:hypothetical protein